MDGNLKQVQNHTQAPPSTASNTDLGRSGDKANFTTFM